MAKVTYHRREDDLTSVRGRFRTLQVSHDGSQYRITSNSHIDDSGHSKLREWGVYEDYNTAVEEAKGKADRQYG